MDDPVNHFLKESDAQCLEIELGLPKKEVTCKMGGGGIAFKEQRIWAFLITRPSDLCNQGGSAIACKGLALTGEQAGEEGQSEKADPLIITPGWLSLLKNRHLIYHPFQSFNFH